MTIAIVAGLTVIAYILIAVFADKKAWISVGTALILLLIGVVSPGQAFFEDINWNVLAIYIGSLILAELFIYSKVPAVIAEYIANKSSSAGLAIAAICLFAGIVSAFVENVATVLVVAPIAIEIAKKVKVPIGPVLVLLAINANLQGTATLVGDPPAMLFAGVTGFSFNDFFFYQGKLSIFFFVEFGALIAFAFTFLYLRKHKGKPEVPRESKVISWVPLALLVAMVAGLAFNSLFESGVGAMSGIICLGAALLGQIWFIFIRKEKLSEAFRIIRELDWETMIFLAGIFVILGGVTRSGAIAELAGFIKSTLGNNPLGMFTLIVGISVLISGFVDNVPYIALMLPLIADIGKTSGIDPMVLYFGLLVGSCLGGNVTPFGASANIVASGLARKNGDPVSFGKFISIGLPFTLITTAATAIAVWLFWKP